MRIEGSRKGQCQILDTARFRRGTWSLFWVVTTELYIIASQPLPQSPDFGDHQPLLLDG